MESLAHGRAKRKKMTDAVAAMLAAAIAHTDMDYLEKIFTQHSPGPDQAGSVFAEKMTLLSLAAATKRAKPHRPPEDCIHPACSYFRIPVPGSLGMVDLKDLPKDAELTLTDPKGTIGTDGGGVAAEFAVEETAPMTVDFSTIIVGPREDDKNILQIWTIHPGECMPRPTDGVNNPELVGKKVNPAQAMELGLNCAKLVRVKNPTHPDRL
jgi:hypothetical protein